MLNFFFFYNCVLSSMRPDQILSSTLKAGFRRVLAVVTLRRRLSAPHRAGGRVLNGGQPCLIHMSVAEGQEVTNGGFMLRPLTSAL